MFLTKPTKKYEKSWHDALKEFQDEKRIGFWNMDKEPTDLDEYIKSCQIYEKGENLPNNRVPATTFWLIDNNKFIGHTNLRHKLNDYLKKEGGNIGYYIRPSERSKGYGTKILELVLVEAKKIGLKKALVTCDQSNIASQKVIEKNGGKYDSKVSSTPEPKLRYWINL